MKTIKKVNRAFDKFLKEQDNKQDLPPKEDALIVIKTFYAIPTIIAGMGNYIRDAGEGSQLDIDRLKSLINELTDIRDNAFNKVKWLQRKSHSWYEVIEPWQFDLLLKGLQKIYKNILPNYQDLIDQAGQLDHPKFSEFPQKVKKIEDALEEIRMKGFFDRVD
jgi:hypothetical protein